MPVIWLWIANGSLDMGLHANLHGYGHLKVQKGVLCLFFA